MNQTQSVKKQMAILLLSSVFSSVFCSQAVQASDSLSLEDIKSIKSIEFSKSLKIRGIEMSEGIYFGQAKVGGKYGIGVVVDSKTFSWGINNRGISISKAF